MYEIANRSHADIPDQSTKACATAQNQKCGIWHTLNIWMVGQSNPDYCANCLYTLKTKCG